MTVTPISEMVARVANAIEALGPGLLGSPIYDTDYVKIAECAIRAMREPTDAMVGEWDHRLETWQAMIDEALR